VKRRDGAAIFKTWDIVSDGSKMVVDDVA